MMLEELEWLKMHHEVLPIPLGYDDHWFGYEDYFLHVSLFSIYAEYPFYSYLFLRLSGWTLPMDYYWFYMAITKLALAIRVALTM